MNIISLAEKLRPKNIDDIIGQDHVLGKLCPLRIALENNIVHSMILWGPAGCGKTTIANLFSCNDNFQFISLSAVFSGIKEIKQVLQEAQKNINTILFIDEIHRFNKSQQDAFLPYIENGSIIFIGATTENPSFEINSALLSRVKVYILNPISENDLKKIIEKALSIDEYKGIKLNENIIELLINNANSDARVLLNSLEILIKSAKSQLLEENITFDFAKKIISNNLKLFDNKGSIFYDQISALHKSVRGSNPDAALYWLCRMLNAEIDIKYLLRRIIRMAWEDIGLADIKAIQIVNEAALSFERLGSEEGELAIAQAVIYLSCAPKSNAGYKAFKDAKNFVNNSKDYPVPLHLRNAPNDFLKKLNYGKEYRYSHDELNAYSVGQKYMPDEIKNFIWYKPVNRGLETKIAEKLNILRNLEKN